MTPGLERLLDEFPDAVIVTTTAGKVLFWSKGAELLFGHTSAETLDRDLRGVRIAKVAKSVLPTELRGFRE